MNFNLNIFLGKRRWERSCGGGAVSHSLVRLHIIRKSENHERGNVVTQNEQQFGSTTSLRILMSVGWSVGLLVIRSLGHLVCRNFLMWREVTFQYLLPRACSRGEGNEIGKISLKNIISCLTNQRPMSIRDIFFSFVNVN